MTCCMIFFSIPDHQLCILASKSHVECTIQNKKTQPTYKQPTPKLELYIPKAS